MGTVKDMYRSCITKKTLIFSATLVLIFITAISLFAQPESKPWMERVESSKVITPPMDRKMEPEEILRIKVKNDEALKIFTMGSMKGGVVRIYAFKGGSPVAQVDNGSGTYRVYYTKEEADEIALYNKGEYKSTARVETGEANSQVLAPGDRMKLTDIQKGGDLFMRFVNMSPQDATIVYTWLDNGKEIEIPEKYRTETLTGKGNASGFEFESAGDTLLFEVKEGLVLIKAGQPFP